jgi:hypothetical protein
MNYGVKLMKIGRVCHDSCSITTTEFAKYPGSAFFNNYQVIKPKTNPGWFAHLIRKLFEKADYAPIRFYLKSRREEHDRLCN